MTDLWVSLAVLGVTVLLSELTRRTVARFPGSSYGIYLLEAASTFQLCGCCHELKLLGETGRVEPGLGLTLTYSMTVVHLLSFRGAACNPIGVLDGLCRGNRSWKAAAGLVLSQFGAAVAARHFAAAVWSLGLSDLHLRHQKFGYRCFDPLGGTVLEAAAVELGSAFLVQAVAEHVQRVDERLQVHCFAGVITALVYTGGSISGAVFNPVLAFSIQFPCSGHSYLEYCFIYWLGPLLGVMSCVLLLERILPFLSGKSSVALDASAAQKQKTQ